MKLKISTGLGERSLYFGMTAVIMYQQFSAKELAKVIKEGEDIKDIDARELALRVDNFRAFAFVVHSGLCNYQDMLEDGNRPTFTESYEFADSMTTEQHNEVWETFSNSRASKSLLEQLPKSEEKKSQVSSKRKKLK